MSDFDSDSGDSMYEDMGDQLDMISFNQLLEMDDDSEREFSRGVVYGYFEQAEPSFLKMEEHFKNKDLHELSLTCKTLKSTSATLGAIRIRSACEEIERLCNAKSQINRRGAYDEEVSFAKIKSILAQCKVDYSELKQLLMLSVYPPSYYCCLGG